MEFSLLDIYVYGAFILFVIYSLGVIWGICYSSPPFGLGLTIVLFSVFVIAILVWLWPVTLPLSLIWNMGKEIAKSTTKKKSRW